MLVGAFFALVASVVPLVVGLLWLGLRVADVPLLIVGLVLASLAFAAFGLVFASIPARSVGSIIRRGGRR